MLGVDDEEFDELEEVSSDLEGGKMETEDSNSTRPPPRTKYSDDGIIHSETTVDVPLSSGSMQQNKGRLGFNLKSSAGSISSSEQATLDSPVKEANIGKQLKGRISKTSINERAR